MLFEEYLEEEEYLEALNDSIFAFIDSLDLDTLSDEQAEALDELLYLITDMDVEYEELEKSGEFEDSFIDDEEDGSVPEDGDLTEWVKKKVVRKGKIIRRIFCKPGFKAMGGKCVKMAAKERRVRKRAAKRTARKAKGHKSSMLRHRARSMRIAKRIGGK